MVYGIFDSGSGLLRSSRMRCGRKAAKSTGMSGINAQKQKEMGKKKNEGI